MKFKELEELEQKNQNIIVIGQSGNFFVAINDAALILSKKTKLKLTCFSKTCKIGFPVKSIKKYIKMLEDENLVFCIYDEDKNEIYFSNGKITKDQIKVCKDCKNCPYQIEQDNYFEELKLISEKNKENFDKRNN